MHINSTANKDQIVNMYKLLAATGKMIKVSELDIGLGDNIKTANATAEMYQQQAEMYQFVIEKYFEIIPKAQQYGITLWSPWTVLIAKILLEKRRTDWNLDRILCS